MDSLDRKIQAAINLLQSIPQEDGPIEISYSGGKDSDVILELAKMAEIDYQAIYKNTTIDPPGTIAHCREKGVTVLQPEKSFFKIIEEKGFPTRRARFCCSVLKEYKVLDRAVQGIRRSESTSRAKRYHEPEICRLYGKGEKARIYLPILEWTDDDVARFISERGIKCHPLYYDEQGNFHVERRLGCIGCPMKSDCGKREFLENPRMLKAWLRSGKKYLDAHPDSSARRKFGDTYNMMYHNLFSKSYEDYVLKTTGGLFPEMAIDAKSFMENYFGVDLTV